MPLLILIFLLLYNAAHGIDITTSSLSLCSHVNSSISYQQRIHIQWTSVNLIFPLSFELHLYRHGVYEEMIADDVRDTGSYTWAPFNTVSPSNFDTNRSGYQIKIIWKQSTGINDISEYFTIERPTTVSLFKPYESFPTYTLQKFTVDFERYLCVPFTSIEGQRFITVVRDEDLKLNERLGAMVITSIGVKITSILDEDIRDLRVDYLVLPKRVATPGNVFLSDVFDAKSQKAANISSIISSTTFVANQWFYINLTNHIYIEHGNDLILDISTSNGANQSHSNTGNLEMTSSSTDEYAAMLAYTSTDWTTAYPYEATPEKQFVQKWFPRFQFNVWDVSKPNATCGSPSNIEEDVLEFQWREILASECTNQNAPACRHDAKIVYYNHTNDDKYVLLYGGRGVQLHTEEFYNDVWIMKLNTNEFKWSRLSNSDCTSSLLPECRYGHSVERVGPYLLVFGGWSSQKDEIIGPKPSEIDDEFFTSNIFFSFNIEKALQIRDEHGDPADAWISGGITSTDNLNTEPERMPRPSYLHASTTDGKYKMFVYGGIAQEFDKTLSRSNQLFSYDIRTRVWSMHTPNMGMTTCDNYICGNSTCSTSSELQCASDTAISYVNDVVYVYGGSILNSDDGGDVATNTLSSYNLITFQAQNLSKHDCTQSGFALPPCRIQHSLVRRNNTIVLFGGGNGTYISNDEWIYDIDLNTWRRTQNAYCNERVGHPSCRSSHATTSHGNVIFMFGGQRIQPGQKFFLNDLWAQGRKPYLETPQHIKINTSANVNVKLHGEYLGNDESNRLVYVDDLENPIQPNISKTIIVDKVIQFLCPSGVGNNISVRVNIIDIISWYSNTIQFISYDRPIITNISIDTTTSQLTSGGGVVRVNGTNFGPYCNDNNACTASTYALNRAASGIHILINGIRCINTTFHKSSNSLEGFAPRGLGIDLPIQVEQSNQFSDIFPYATYSYSAPIITSIVFPSSLSTNGGDIITIYGSNYGDTSVNVNVYVNMIACASTIVINTTLIHCITPAGTGKDLAVTLNANGAVSDAFTQLFSYSPPILTAITQTTLAVTSGGTPLTIFGANFGTTQAVSNARVYVNDIECTNMIWEPTRITCESPPSSGKDVMVCLSVGAEGNAQTTCLPQFSYAPPTIKSISPSVSKLGESTRITINGNNFGNFASLITVELSDFIICSDIQVIDSDTSVSCTLPAFDEEVTLILTLTCNTQESNGILFTYGIVAYSSSLVRGINVMAGILIVVYMGIGIIFWMNRESTVVKASSYLFSNLIIFGGVLVMISLFFQSQQRLPLCTIALWLGLIGVTFQYGTLVFKNYRILRIFKNTQISRSNLMKDSQLMLWILGLVVYDAIFLIPLSVMAENCTFPSETTPLLLLGFIIIGKVVLIVAGVVIAIESRHIHMQEFQERHTLGYAIYSSVLFMILFIPVMIVFRDEEEQSYALRCIALMMVTTATMGIIFIPKIYAIFKPPTIVDENAMHTTTAGIRRWKTQNSAHTLERTRTDGGNSSLYVTGSQASNIQSSYDPNDDLDVHSIHTNVDDGQEQPKRVHSANEFSSSSKASVRMRRLKYSINLPKTPGQPAGSIPDSDSDDYDDNNTNDGNNNNSNSSSIVLPRNYASSSFSSL